MGITGDEYDDWQSQMKVTNVVSLDEFVEQGSDIADNHGLSSQIERPEEAVEKEELKKMLMEALDQLTEKERKLQKTKILIFISKKIKKQNFCHVKICFLLPRQKTILL